MMLGAFSSAHGFDDLECIEALSKKQESFLGM
jgi:hypothetical protein